MPAHHHPTPIQSELGSEHIQRPQCCVLPQKTEAKDYLGSFVSLRDGTWIKLGIAIILAGQSMVWGLAVNLSSLEPFSPVYWTLHSILAGSAIVVILMLGLGLLKEFFRSVRQLQLGIESLFMLSLMGALGGSLFATIRGSGDIYYEVIIVVLVIFSFGRKIGQVSRERAMIEAHRYREQFDSVVSVAADGGKSVIPYCQLVDGDRFEVTPGMPVCANGIILSGSGFVRETALTGEPHPIAKKEGDAVRAGTWSVDGTFICEAQITSSTRLIDSILANVSASIQSTQSQRQIQADRWIQTFVMVVCLIALLTGLYWGRLSGFSVGWLRSMSVLLVACPCALGLATPLAVWTGLWQLSSMGVISRASNFIDALAHTRHLFFDKTGTLTQSSLSIGQVRLFEPCPWSKETVLRIGAVLESNIHHPIAHAFHQENASVVTADELPDGLEVLHSHWIPGKGIEAKVRWNHTVTFLRFGTPAWVSHRPDEVADSRPATTRKHIAMGIGDVCVAEVDLVEDLRPGVIQLIKRLQALGIRCSILTGDPFPQWNQLAGANVRENLSPDDKAALVRHAEENGECPIFIGDGVNDLNAMLTASASIAIHDGGASLTQSNSSAILTGNHLEPIANAIRLARRIDQTLVTNLRIAVVYNTIGISMAATGLLHPVASVLIMIVSSLLVTFRAIRKAEAIAELS